MTSRIILTTKNDFVDEINDMLIHRFSGDATVYTAIDETIEPNDQNLNPTEGLCNGTQLICRDFKSHVISATISSGHFKNKHLSDFGLAIAGWNLSKSNIKLSGTLAYVAPEYLLHDTTVWLAIFPTKMVLRLNIDRIELATRDWICKVQIVEMGRPRESPDKKCRFQNLILEDEEECQIKAVMYADEIEQYADKLKLINTYLISTARV
ncbi:hypothetical protein H5410_046456 [Solanum commersonii]|uniref:ATP-dependent DNA helicase n=1 Tax=Solanum commersonii TaxID=4109 RepID=A0A9J5XFQ6_SOLCO|nr:hypothetical protein H5410_046456 [Solanum commersonii]